MDRIPPQNLEAEQSTLGSMMLEKDALLKGMEILRAEDFYRPAHQEVFDALCALAVKDEPADLITMQEELRKRGKLEDIGGTEYLMALVDSVPTAANIEYYSHIVEKKSILRKLISAGTQIIGMAQNEDVDVEVAKDKALELITSIGDDKPSEFMPIKEHVKAFTDRLEKISKGEMPFKVGFTCNNLTNALDGGPEAGNLFVVGMDTSQGKSVVLKDMLITACRDKTPSALFTCEMTGVQYVGRIVSQLSSVPSQILKRGPINADNWQLITTAEAEIYNWNLHVQETSPTIDELERRIRTWVTKSHCRGNGLVVIDYAGLIRRKGTASEENIETGRIITRLKSIADTLGLVVATASQVRKDIPKTRNVKPEEIDTRYMTADKAPFPRLDDLLGASAIKNDADIVVIGYNPPESPYQVHEDGVKRRKAFLHVAKYRDGEAGRKFPVWFEQEYTRFVDIDERYETEAPPHPMTAYYTTKHIDEAFDEN